ncbi:Lipolytic enzyme [Halomonas sp. A3H3]|uniref:alpha/beta hydrolase fold domain-containing protein n=1 Tax=unclassified Halomonas TaxID=2609666 RepID=UPI00038C9CC2|nr:MULTISPECIES: alpha/beta hydrolase [unclassified Halomonas]CDG55946.1 Lipolytic enzyme [Halomonas sp. A3H3]
MIVDDFIQRFNAGLAKIKELQLPQARRAYVELCQTFAPPDPAGMRVENSALGGVRVRRFIPQQRTPGCVLFIHGGGFTIGSTESHHGPAASLAQMLEREVVSVNYRLAPEVDYPTMLADCRTVLEAIYPVALVGDSAGGRLAIDLAHQQNEAPPLGLIYPTVGALSLECLGEDAPLLSRDDVLDIRQQCPDIIATQRDRRPPAASIEMLTVERDPLTLPIEAAIANWREEGASVGYRCAPNMVHAALHAHALLPGMSAAWQDFCQKLKQRLN